MFIYAEVPEFETHDEYAALVDAAYSEEATGLLCKPSFATSLYHACMEVEFKTRRDYVLFPVLLRKLQDAGAAVFVRDDRTEQYHGVSLSDAPARFWQVVAESQMWLHYRQPWQ
jgi:hypothetical protein